MSLVKNKQKAPKSVGGYLAERPTILGALST